MHDSESGVITSKWADTNTHGTISIDFRPIQKHASPSIVHLVTPETFERLNVTGDGSASGIALLGHAFEHALQSSHISLTPNRIGLSASKGISVKIFPNRTLEPNSGVITRPCLRTRLSLPERRRGLQGQNRSSKAQPDTPNSG